MSYINQPFIKNSKYTTFPVPLFASLCPRAATNWAHCLIPIITEFFSHPWVLTLRIGFRVYPHLLYIGTAAYLMDPSIIHLTSISLQLQVSVIGGAVRPWPPANTRAPCPLFNLSFSPHPMCNHKCARFQFLTLYIISLGSHFKPVGICTARGH